MLRRLPSVFVACLALSCSGVPASSPADSSMEDVFDGEAPPSPSPSDSGVSAPDAEPPLDATTAPDASAAPDAAAATDATVSIDAASADASTCAAGLVRCANLCVNPATNPAHCGACNVACTAGQVCVGGSCTRGTCPTGTTSCGSACVVLASDPANCGRCGNVCAANQACVAGTCRVSCTAPLVACGSTCVAVASDPANCGRCGNVCASGQACTAGTCGSACGASVSFAQQVQPIFNAECTGCHRSIAPSGGLPLVAGASYAALVNVAAVGCSDGRRRVKPGDANASLLYQKMAGSGFCSGGVMPLSGVLPAQTVDIVRRWVCQGAPNN